MGEAINDLVKKGKISAPIAIGRDHLDTGSVASPYRETEKMLDGSDAVADWPLLNFALNTASGATWVSFHHGGGVGMGFSLACGAGDGGGRNGDGFAKDCASPQQRSGYRGGATRGCGL